MHLTRELARAERLQVRGLADGHGPRQLQGDQRQPRPPRRRPRALRGRARAAHGDPPLRHLRPLRRRRVHRRAVGLRRGRSGAQARRSCSRASTRCYFEARPGKRLPLGISVGTAVFPQDGESYEALLATADSRMYQDKADRKRRAREGDQQPAAQRPAHRPDPALQRSAAAQSVDSTRGGARGRVRARSRSVVRHNSVSCPSSSLRLRQSGLRRRPRASSASTSAAQPFAFEAGQAAMIGLADRERARARTPSRRRRVESARATGLLDFLIKSSRRDAGDISSTGSRSARAIGVRGPFGIVHASAARRRKIAFCSSPAAPASRRSGR